MVLECIQVGAASYFSGVWWSLVGHGQRPFAPQTLLAILNFLPSDLQAKQGVKGGMDEWGFVALLKMEGFFVHCRMRPIGR